MTLNLNDVQNLMCSYILLAEHKNTKVQTQVKEDFLMFVSFLFKITTQIYKLKIFLTALMP